MKHGICPSETEYDAQVVKEDAAKKYRSGMFGGKFMPFHKGHYHCVELASAECDIVHVVLMYGGNQEKEILAHRQDDWLQVGQRFEATKRMCAKLPNVVVHKIDVSDCIFEDGSENWDAETPLMLAEVGHFDVVYGSEPAYADYFHRAYPWAEYVIVDKDRVEVPISGTKIREMSEGERKLWTI